MILTGESGTGKELCATWLVGLLGAKGRFVAHNCARFASAEEAEAALFAVANGVFSGVDARAGLLEDAEGGVLFLDEVHGLPVRVQRSLLRFVEDGIHQRIGGSTSRPSTVRLVFGTNVPLDSAGLAEDLMARLFPIEIPSLRDRRADVPNIFLHVLARAAGQQGLDAEDSRAAVSADHLEALCLADLSGKNVRALEALATVADHVEPGGAEEPGEAQLEDLVMGVLRARTTGARAWGRVRIFVTPEQ